jgi:glycosyltransferase involved in cell wall biosynthesis
LTAEDRRASTTLIVVPCFNEEDRLPVADYLAFLVGHPLVQFLFVDDGSRDGTARVLDALARKEPNRIEVLSLPRNVGKGEAVRAGMQRGVERGADFIGFWDADLSAPLDSVDSFVDQLETDPDIDLVVGSRHETGLADRSHWIRRWFGVLAARFGSRFLGLPVRDPQCGAKLFRNHPALRLALGSPFHTRWIFDVELLARWSLHCSRSDPALAVAEVSIRDWTAVPGSKLRWWDFLAAPFSLLSIIWRHRRSKRS